MTIKLTNDCPTLFTEMQYPVNEITLYPIQVILQLLFIQDVSRRRIASADQVGIEASLRLKWNILYFAGPLKTRTSNRYIPIDLQSLNLGNLHFWGSESGGVSSSGQNHSYQFLQSI